MVSSPTGLPNQRYVRTSQTTSSTPVFCFVHSFCYAMRFLSWLTWNHACRPQYSSLFCKLLPETVSFRWQHNVADLVVKAYLHPAMSKSNIHCRLYSRELSFLVISLAHIPWCRDHHMSNPRVQVLLQAIHVPVFPPSLQPNARLHL